MSSFDSYIICTSPRSGSTLLCNLLATTGKAGNPDSYFHHPSVDTWLRQFSLKLEKERSRQELLHNIIHSALKVGKGNTDVCGLRLQGHSLNFFLKQLTLLHPACSTDTARIEASFGQTLFIHLTRCNKIEQSVSLLKAEQSGLWHRATNGSELERQTPEQELRYDREKISTYIQEVTELDRKWLVWFEQEKIQPLRITYEQLAAHPVDTLRDTLSRLNLNIDSAVHASPGVRKLADGTNQNWVRRFCAERKKL